MRPWTLAIFFLAWPGFAWAGLPETVAQVKPSILAVGTFQRTRSPPAVFRGTGFAVADGRYVLTCAHVLPDSLDEEKSELLAVFFRFQRQDRLRRAQVVATDPAHDLALLKISGDPLPVLALGDSNRVREGEEYAFTGYPIGMVLGLYPVTHLALIASITPIAIPALRADKLDPKLLPRLYKPFSVFQLDATAYPGNSGSPLYHPETGEVVGILNKVFVQESKESLLSKPSGISYAIPIEYARKLLKKLQPASE
nr:peptidase S1/S6 chymotrypsin/Hap [uncultured Gammaproteobacteria bacterium]